MKRLYGILAAFLLTVVPLGAAPVPLEPALLFRPVALRPLIKLNLAPLPLFDVACTSSTTTCGGGGASATGNNVWTGTNSFIDANFSLKDDVAPTKTAQFQLSGITAGNNRIVTLPDSDVTLGAAPLDIGGATNAFARLEWNTTQTPDTAMLLTGTTSNNFIVAERQDSAFDFAHAAATNPTLLIHSANQSTTQWLGLQHDGTNGIISTGTGTNIGFAPAAGGTIAAFGTQSNFALGSAARVGWSSNADPTTAADDLKLYRDAAATLQMGVDINGAAVAQTLKAHDGITGANVAGAALTLSSGIGTGNAAGASTNLGRTLMTGAGTGAQTRTQGLTVCESKTLSNTSATAQALANITLASNSSGAARVTVSVQCTDGTNFDSDIVTSYVAFVNKATVVTVGTPVTTASAAANNSGSCTVAPTFVANGNTIDIKVTPVFTTIVPTTVTGYINVENLGTGVVACQ